MANWLSSRLKAAENLLQQIDKQAAVTLQHKEKDGQSPSGLVEERTPERRSQSLRKDPFGSPSTSDQGPQSSRGRGKLFDRAPEPSKSGGGRRVSGEGRQQRTQGQKSSSKPTPSTQGNKSATEGRDDWSELLGSSDLVSTSSLSRSSSRGGDLDGYSSALKSTRGTKPSGSSIKGTHTPNNGLTQSSKSHSNGDLLSYNIQMKADGHQLSPPKDSLKLARVLSYTSVDKANSNAPKDNIDQVDGGFHEINSLGKEAKNIVNVSNGKDEVRPTGGALPSNGSDLVREVDSRDENQKQANDITEIVPSAKTDEVVDGTEVKGLQQTYGPADEITEVETTGDEGEVFHDSLGKQDGNSVVYVGAEEAHSSARVFPDDSNGGENVEPEGNGDVESSALEGIHTQDDEDMRLAVELANRLDEGRETYSQDGNESQEEILSIHSLSNSEEDSSDSGSDRDSDSDDSEYEEKRRAKRMALRRKLAKRRAMEARAAAEEAARNAIKEREDFVERLQQERDSLEALLAEGEEQHVKMAAELRKSMLEVVQLLEQEKVLHNNTRRQGLESEVKLEAENAELAKSLAASQWDLEDITSQVSKARAMVEAKVDMCSDLQREATVLRIRLSRPHRSQRAIDDAFEAESMEEDKSRILARIEELKIQAEDFEDRLKRLLDRQVAPTSIQLELESQLAQITDSLIHKQAQVEELSTEKATLIFRVEAVSNTLREERLALTSRSAKRNPNKGTWSDWSYFDEDLEYGFGKTYSSKDKAWEMEDRYDHHNEGSSMQPFLRLLRQVDGLVMGAALVLRSNGVARAFTGLYLLALHWWVIFILFSHPAAISDVNSGSSSDAVVSTLSGAHLSILQNTTSFS